jgi:hypothetical protein
MSTNNFYIKYFDVILSVAILIASIIYCFSQVMNPNSITFPLILALFSVIYIYFRKKISNHYENELKPNLNALFKLTVLNNILFFITLMSLVWILFIYNYPYPVYFWLIALIGSISILVSIFYTTEICNLYTILKMVALITIIRSRLYYAFPEIYGIDTFFHSAFCQEILNSNRIPGGGSFLAYSYYPAYHLLLSQMKYISCFSIRDSMFIIGILQLLILCILIYLIGEKISNKRAGLLASFMFCLSANVIFSGISLIPNMFGLILYALNIYMILNLNNRPSVKILMILCMISLVFTHPYPPVILLLVMVVAYGTSIFINRVAKIPLKRMSFRSQTMLFLMILYITNLAIWGRNEYFRVVVWDLFVDVNGFKGVPSAIATEAYLPSIQSFMYNNLSNYLLIGLCLFGSLAWLNMSRKANEKKVILAILSLSLILYIYLVPIFGVTFIPLPYRVWPFAFFIISILSSYALLCLSKILYLKNYNLYAIFIIAISSIIFFTSVTSSMVNPDGGFYSEESGYRASLLPSEITSINYLVKYSNDSLKTDSYCEIYTLVKNYTNLHANIVSPKNKRMTLLRSDFLRTPILRYLSKFPDTINSQINQSDYENMMDIKGWNVVYVSGTSWIYRN